MALTETIAHLEYLVTSERASKRVERDLVYYFTE
jgi:hypothetical protein